jgi:uncharacterized protein
MTDGYDSSIEAWRRHMDERLRAPNGWLALAGLFWLHEGRNRIGADPAADVVLPESRAPSLAGVIDLRDGQARLRASGLEALQVEGVPVREIELIPDTSESPTFLELGDLRMVLIARGGRCAIRLWDNLRPERRHFPGRVWHPVNPAWRVRARYSPHDPPARIQVPNELGDVTVESSLGRVSFRLHEEDYELEALEGDDGGLFLVFGDETNRDISYPSGRFLKTDPPGPDGVILDFNRAYSPPCAFTRYATCPLPPLGNRLAVRVEAGELRPAGSGIESSPDWTISGSARTP